MSFGIWQLVLILAIVFVLFGAGKLPRVMGDVGKGIRSLKEGLKEDETRSVTDKSSADNTGNADKDEA